MPSSKKSSADPKWEAPVLEKDFKRLEKFVMRQADEAARLQNTVRAQSMEIDKLRLAIAALRQQLSRRP